MPEAPIGALSGVRVVDLSHLLPGPLATWILRRLGADVIKVERPEGDGMRHMPPFVDGTNAAYGALNRGKRHVALDLRREADRATLRRLIASADVVVEQFRPGVLARLGLDPEALRAEHPSLILCSLTGYGQTGPYAARAGHDLNYLAAAGLLEQGPAPRGPVDPFSFQAADVGGGAYYAVMAILAALLRRGATGAGAHLDVAMTEGALPLRFFDVIATMRSGGGPSDDAGWGVKGPIAGGMACYNTYLSKDGRTLALGALEPKFWLAFCAAVGRPDWGPRQLGGDQVALRAEVAALFAERTAAAWEAALADADCCFEVARDASEVARHPQLSSRGILDHPDDGPALPALDAVGVGPAPPDAPIHVGADDSLLDPYRDPTS